MYELVDSNKTKIEYHCKSNRGKKMNIEVSYNFDVESSRRVLLQSYIIYTSSFFSVL